MSNERYDPEYAPGYCPPDYNELCPIYGVGWAAGLCEGCRKTFPDMWGRCKDDTAAFKRAGGVFDGIRQLGRHINHAKRRDK